MKEYHFDYQNALGDTVSEKLESLFIFLVNINKENPIRFIVGHKDIIQIFESLNGPVNKEAYMRVVLGTLEYAGSWIFSRQDFPSFHMFKSENAARNQVVLFGETDNAVIEFIF